MKNFQCPECKSSKDLLDLAGPDVQENGEIYIYCLCRKCDLNVDFYYTLTRVESREPKPEASDL